MRIPATEQKAKSDKKSKKNQENAMNLNASNSISSCLGSLKRYIYPNFSLPSSLKSPLKMLKSAALLKMLESADVDEDDDADDAAA